jgi:non-ribosomal peptide synthetase component F
MTEMVQRDNLLFSYLKGFTPTIFPERSEHDDSPTYQVSRKTVSIESNHGKDQLKNIIIAAYGLTLSKHADVTDVLFGLSFENREIYQPLRFNADPQQSVEHHLQKIEQMVSGLKNVPTVPSMDLINSYLGDSSMAQHEPFETRLRISFGEGETSHAHPTFALDVTVLVSSPAMEIEVEYDSNRLCQTEINWFLSQFGQAVLNLQKNFKLGYDAFLLGDVSLLSADAEMELKSGIRPTIENYVSPVDNEYLHQVFERQAALTPDLIAVHSLDEDGLELTYQHIDSESNRLANLLQQRGVKAGDFVPICFEKCADMVIAIMGILKSGAAYIPLHISNPVSRTLHM